MTAQEIGQEVVNFFLRLSDPIRNLHTYHGNPSAYIAGEVAAGRLHSEAKAIVESGNTAQVQAAMQDANPQTFPNVVFPPQ